MMDKVINVTYSKASNILYLFSIIRKYLSKISAICILKAMARPYLEYFFSFYRQNLQAGYKNASAKTLIYQLH